MNVIIFTGANLAAQAEASRLAMVQASAARIGAFCALGIDNVESVDQFIAMRHRVYVWQIGDQANCAVLSAMADHHITDADLRSSNNLAHAIGRALMPLIDAGAIARPIPHLEPQS